MLGKRWLKTLIAVAKRVVEMSTANKPKLTGDSLKSCQHSFEEVNGFLNGWKVTLQLTKTLEGLQICEKEMIQNLSKINN